MLSERLVTYDWGRIVAEFGVMGKLLIPPGDGGYCPKSVMLGLRLSDEDDASLCRNLREFGVLGRLVMVGSYKVEESAVLTDVVGDPGRA